MRTVFEEEEEEIEHSDLHSEPEQDREVTINSTTLLAIFFGLVLVCGLFFGLGYTVGRRAPVEASQLPSDKSSATSNSALQPAQNAPKPSAASQPVSTPAAAPDDAQAADATSSGATTEPQDVSNQPKPAAPVNTAPLQVKPAIVPAAQQATAPAPHAPAVVAAALPTAPAAAGPVAAPVAGIMVQIAAISNPADANVLVGALQKRGYSVTGRRLPGDSLIHVQIGPFSSKAEANAMKQKLLSDGYNAFLK